MTTRGPGWIFAAVTAVALVLNLGFGLARGLDRPMESDAYYYFQLAESLAAGGGYVVRDGFWPDAPSAQRMPAWPAAVALALRGLPEAPPAAVMRALDLVLNAVCAPLVAALTWWLIRRPLPTLLAGLGFAIYPVGIVCADEGLSEPLFLLLAMAGVLLLLRGLPTDRAASTPTPARLAGLWLGFLLLGMASLARANFLLWLGFFGVGLACWAWHDGWWRRPAWWGILALGALLFLAPPLGWAARNAKLYGAFPVLSTLRGQTFYGGNNALVATDPHYWGYWVFPNQIPGERTLLSLSRTMSEYEVDVYYYEKGRAYLREHPGQVPGMLLGKLVRAYVPVPWVWLPGSVVLAGIRFLLYALVGLGIAWQWREWSAAWRVVLAALVLTNVAMVLMFYGYTRFAFALEPFLMPLAAVAGARLLAGLWSRFPIAGSSSGA